MIQILEKWDGSFAEDSVAATVYSYWQMYFYRSLFHIQIPDHDEASEAQRMSISDNYQFLDFYQRFIRKIAAEPDH